MGSFISSLFDPAAGASPAASPEQSRVIVFHSSPRWHLYFDEAKTSPKLMVVDFSAKWCGPCKMMEPAFHDMSAKYTDVDFVKIDVDELSDVAEKFDVKAMPTFVVLKQGKEVHRIIGAKLKELEKTVENHREMPKFAA